MIDYLSNYNYVQIIKHFFIHYSIYKQRLDVYLQEIMKSLRMEIYPLWPIGTIIIIPLVSKHTVKHI